MTGLSVSCTGCFQNGPMFDRGFALAEAVRLTLDDLSIRSSSTDFDRVDISPTIVLDTSLVRPWITHFKKYRTVRVSDAIDFDDFVAGSADYQAGLFAECIAKSIRRIKSTIIEPGVADELVSSIAREIASQRRSFRDRS